MRSLGHLKVLTLCMGLCWTIASCENEPRQPPQAIEPPQATRPSALASNLPANGGQTGDIAAELPTATDRDPASELLVQAITSSRSPQSLAIDHLLIKGDVRQLTGFTDALDTHPLEGQPPSASYNAFRIAPLDQYGVGVQVWALGGAQETSRHYNRLRETYVGATENSGTLGDRFFVSDFGGIRQLVFVSRRHSRVVALSCSESFCSTEGTINRLAELVLSRL